MDFVDIQKTFNSVPRKQIRQSLRRREMKTKLRNNVKAIYEVTRNSVMKDRVESEEFVTKEGLRKKGI